MSANGSAIEERSTDVDDPSGSSSTISSKIWRLLSASGTANIVTACALVFAAWSFAGTNALQQQLNDDQLSMQKKIAANQVWASYIEWSFANTQFVNSEFSVNEEMLPRNEQHAWFMERLLSAAEEILNAYPGDFQWEDTFVYEFQLHESYFTSDYFLGDNSNNGVTTMSFYCSYDPPVRNAIQKAFSDDPEHTEKMREVRERCARNLGERGNSNA